MKKFCIISAFIGALISLGFLMFYGCGDKSHEIVEIEKPAPEVIEKEVDKSAKCGEFNAGSIKKTECSVIVGPGYIGEVVEFCNEGGEWSEISKNCKKECDDEQLQLDQNLVTFDNTVRKIMIDHCVECHATYSNHEVAYALADEMYRLISLPASNDDCMPKNKCDDIEPADIEDIKSWIESGKQESGNCAVKEAFIDLDDQETAALAYVPEIDEDDRKFLRFFTFAHRFNNDEDVNQHETGLNLALNNLSFDTEVFQCTTLIEAQNALCVLDIRSIGLTPFDFARIEAADKINFISNTTKGKLLRQLLETDQAVWHFDTFIDTVFTNNDLYRKIMEIDDLRDQALLANGIRFARDVADLEFIAIGTNSSDISAVRNTRLITRFEGKREGIDIPCWLTFDNGPDSINDAGRDLFQNPFIEGAGSDKNFVFDAQELICTLPNKVGLLFALYDANGLSADFAPTNIVTCNNQFCLDSQIDTPIDCMNCHASGYLPEVDVIGAHIQNSGVFNNVDREIALQIYQNSTRNSATFNRDNLEIQKEQRELGRVLGQPSQITVAHVDYKQNQNAKQIAAFFHRREGELLACIRSSDVLRLALNPLLDGNKVNHDIFVQEFDNIVNECRFLEDPILP